MSSSTLSTLVPSSEPSLTKRVGSSLSLSAMSVPTTPSSTVVASLSITDPSGMHRPHATDNANSDRTATLSDSFLHWDTEADRNTAKSLNDSTNHTKALSSTSPLPRSSTVHASTLQDSSNHFALSNTMSASSMSPSPTLSQASPSSMATASNDVLRTLSMSSTTGHGRSSGTAATSISSSSTLMTATHSSTPIHHSSGSMATATIPTGVSDVKLKRVLEHNQRLKEQLDMGRISVSEASESLIKFVTSTKDSFLPHIWGSASADPFSKQNSRCCIIS